MRDPYRIHIDDEERARREMAEDRIQTLFRLAAEYVPPVKAPPAREVLAHGPMMSPLPAPDIRVLIAEERTRLERQMVRLELEHAALHARPFNRTEHRTHRARLRQHIEEVRLHLLLQRQHCDGLRS